jgi:Na+/H+-translocating membrane pyrophosphatase
MLPMILILGSGVIALLFAVFTAIRLLRVDAGNQRMREIGDAIKAGAAAFF